MFGVNMTFISWIEVKKCIFHLRSLISLHFALYGQTGTQSFFMQTTNTLIRLRGCASLPESSLTAVVSLARIAVPRLKSILLY